MKRTLGAKTVNETALKKLVKAAVAEALEERRDWVREALAEAIEEVGLVRAVEAGARTRTIGRDKVFDILRKRK